MRLLPGALVLVLGLVGPQFATAQNEADLAAINDLIDRYGVYSDAMNMEAQSTLMTPDRVWIRQGFGRRTDQEANMRIQQAEFDLLKQAFPGIRFFTEDRDRLIKFYGDGSVAVASFYRYRTSILPVDTPREVAERFKPTPPRAFSLVIEKRDDGWKIVHVHFSDFGS